MTGIKDVAREVGVSTATVSRALRGLPRVSPDTRERVLEVAGRMGYVASPHAASLASGQTRAIGVVVPNVTRWFFGSIVHGAEELLREEGYDLLLYSVVADPAARKRLFSTHLLSKRVDAVMVLALRPTPEEVEALDRTGSPTVVVGGAVPGWSSVRIDDVETAATAVRHLVGLGHTRIAHLGGVPDPEHAGLGFSAPGDRLAGYRMAMQEAGLPIEPDWEVTGDFTALGGLTACRLLLSASTRPTAIFAGSDEMAIGAAQAIREAGLDVPGDISVIGIDNHELSEYFDLTTMAQPAPELGRLGARMLLDALHSETPLRPVETIVPTQLIVRGTTARVG
ncbi:LacI family DNA-binding transcriptional regulator [Marmoricola sp. URHB0036]|uniref:LacI family DNA-binding transcriptional regulator n=1 Tax=Marmoricola sp. URHB0036 TaxID=1298863 RepID=UPI0004045D1D|nr:LacI family DNA-binding transcriptional regulator [Marmoricola sp. URHB0036]